MADNWLEKREQQLKGGTIIYRKANQSLETLLHKVASGDNATSAAGGGSPIRNAQLEAIARSAKILFPELPLQWDEQAGTITWHSNALTPHQTGAAILAMQLKACELGFCTQVNLSLSSLSFSRQ